MSLSPNKRNQSDLFGSYPDRPLREVPLAERLRPQNLSELVGQEHILGEDQPLRQAIEGDCLPSMILWGPPGSGKTTLAGVIARTTKAAFAPISAILGGLPELRSIFQEANLRRRESGQRTIVFVDEIHRFNKAQQDAFLPHVERGDIILIGATTQNPSFEVISPLLSRSMVVVLHPLQDEAMNLIIDRALSDRERGCAACGVTLTPEAKRLLIRHGNGDARVMLTALEFAVNQVTTGKDEAKVLDGDALHRALLKQSLRYDRDGDEHYNVISAYIKSLRDSDPQGALYWLARMLEGGEDPKFIARRMIIFASEDIGNADPQALLVATAVFKAVEVVGLPESQINLAHGTAYLASSPKSNACYVGLREAQKDARESGNLPVPLHLRNAVTPLMQEFDFGKGYRYVHNDPGARIDQPHLPEKLKGRRYYRPNENQIWPSTDPSRKFHTEGETGNRKEENSDFTKDDS